MTDVRHRWIGLRRPARSPRLRMFALPYAGGGASVYRRWLSDIEHRDDVDFVAVQLPGRENRSGEPHHTSMEPAVDELERSLGTMREVPVVLVGYSMGAVLAYELAIRLISRGVAVQHAILAARTPPYHSRPRRGAPPLTREEIIGRIKRLGGTAPGVIDSDLFDGHFLPTLQADFTLADSFGRRTPQVLPCGLLALGARDDPEVAADDVRAWGQAAGGPFDVQWFEGGHFFLHTAHAEVVACVNAQLARCLGGLA